MSKATKTKTKTTKAKAVPFAQLRIEYAKRKGVDVTKASKQLRAKLRGHYDKDPVIKKYVDRKGTNADGNRYPDATPAEAKHILAM